MATDDLQSCVAHACSSANATQQKMYNWNTLNQKVLKRMGFALPKDDLIAMCNCQPGAVERTLKLMKGKIEKSLAEGLQGWGHACMHAPRPCVRRVAIDRQQPDAQRLPADPRNHLRLAGARWMLRRSVKP